VAATARSVELRSIAQGITDALPMTVVEVVLTGSVSRGVADEISDIEMLLVTERTERRPARKWLSDGREILLRQHPLG
jgi:predicted nucleotidyltransferase